MKIARLDANNQIIEHVVHPDNQQQFLAIVQENHDKKIVKQEHHHGHLISTVFLSGIPHGFNQNEYFETMINGGKLQWYLYARYRTYAQAEKGHRAAVAWFDDFIAGKVTL